MGLFKQIIKLQIFDFPTISRFLNFHKGKVMTKTIVKIACLLGIFMSFSFGANEFGEAQNIINQADMAGKGVLGTIIKWTFSLALPIICMGGVTLMAYTQQKKKAEQQDQNPNKIYFVMGIAAIVGFFLYLIVTTIISYALFRDTGYIFNVISTFFKQAVM